MNMQLLQFDIMASGQRNGIIEVKKRLFPNKNVIKWSIFTDISTFLMPLESFSSKTVSNYAVSQCEFLNLAYFSVYTCKDGTEARLIAAVCI